MTTLNTIIEEEKKGAKESILETFEDGTMRYCPRDLETKITTAMQRAYEAGHAHWLRSEIEKFEVTQREHFCTLENGNDYDHGAWDVYDSIITRYKEELLELEKGV